MIIENDDATVTFRQGETRVTPKVPRNKWWEQSCPTCLEIWQAGGFGPSHLGSSHCLSGSLASGGKNAHCTCDTCF